MATILYSITRGWNCECQPPLNLFIAFESSLNIATLIIKLSMLIQSAKLVIVSSI